jgi:hypothetical protein
MFHDAHGVLRLPPTSEPLTMSEEMPHLGSLGEIVQLLDDHLNLYVRWSRGPDWDSENSSCDELTGVRLPGLSANALAVEPWWQDRSLQLWVARRLYDYQHLRQQRGAGVRPWLLCGEEVGRGPDNEPLVRCDRPLAWIDEQVVGAATDLVDSQRGDWGPLNRRDDNPGGPEGDSAT